MSDSGARIRTPDQRVRVFVSSTLQELADERAKVYVAQGDLDSALQLLAVVLHHPACEQSSLYRTERLRDETETLRAQIETRLDQPRYQSAWKAGQKKRLAEVVAQILA